MPRRCRSTPTRTTRRGRRCGEDAGERLESVEAFAVARRPGVAGRRATRGCGSCRVDELAREGLVVDPAFDGGSSRGLAATRSSTPTAVVVADESYTAPPGRGRDVDFATGARTELLRKEAPGFDPAAYVAEQRVVPVVGRDAGRRPRSCGAATPRSTAPRRASCTPTAPTSRSARTRSGTRRSRRLLDRGVVYVHAHIRGGGEGGRRWWLDGRLEHKQHTFDDHIAVADGLAAPAWSTATGSPPAACPRAGCSRARSSRSGRTAGGPWWPRSRSSTSSPRCSTRRSR